MSRVTVQCKGSGQRANARRAFCSVCGKGVDVAGNGNLRKHMRTTTTARLRAGR